MTAAGIGLRRKGKVGHNVAGHVAFEASRAVRAGVMHVSSLTGLSIWQRFVVALLKVTSRPTHRVSPANEPLPLWPTPADSSFRLYFISSGERPR